MQLLHLLSYFFGGAFLSNAVPHFVAGCMGRAFQTPFANPPGKGLSSSTVNVLWGSFNFAAGYLLLMRIGAFQLRCASHVLAAGSGALVLALMASRTFGKLHGGL